MNVGSQAEAAVAGIAAAIGEPARARMLYCLMDDHARTSTELACVADVTPSTASVHLNRLRSERLVKVFAQGKHRYYSLASPDVASTLEGLIVLAGDARSTFVPSTPSRLCAARTCYDHIAGTLGVLLHDRLKTLGVLSAHPKANGNAYDITASGSKALAALGIDVDEARTLRRRFAFACLDWSVRRPHLGGAVAAALLRHALKKKWVTQDLDSRALSVTPLGRRQLLDRFGLQT